MTYEEYIEDCKKYHVIQCKDCKYFFGEGEYNGNYGSCTRILGGDVVKETDFCSKAKQDDISNILDTAAHTVSGLLDE